MNTTSRSKKILNTCLLLGTLSVISSTAFAAEEMSGTIAVSGEAQILVAPNQMMISMSVMNTAKTIDSAKKANDKTVNEFISYLTDTLKIAPKYIQTDSLSVNYSYFNCSTDEKKEGSCDPLLIEYYDLNKGIQLKLTDLTKYEDIISSALALGVNKINNIQFVTTELRKHKDKAREMATIAAKEKAQAAASTLDMTLGKPYSIDLNDSSSSYFGRSRGSNLAMNAVQNTGGTSMNGNDSGLAVGQISVSASVAISFSMH